MLKIKEMNTNIMIHFEQLTDIRTHMRNQFKEFVEKNKVNKVFGLDSFHYQSRLLDVESKHLYEQYSFIRNRMYCDYYKLYAMVKVWYKESFKLEPKKRNYPVYKDLEQYTLFEFTDIHNLDMDITEMLQKISEIICKKEEDTLQDKNSKASLHIDHYIHHHDYNNSLLRTKMLLYEKYLTSYHIYHMSFLAHLMDRLLLLFRQNTNTVKLGEIENWVDVPVFNKRVDSVSIQESTLIDLNESLLIEPVIEPIEPVVEPAESVAEPVEPVVEPAEPIPEPIEPVEPVAEPIPEPIEPVVEPVAEPIPEPAEPIPEPIEPVAEPVYPVEPIVEPAEPVYPAEPVEPVYPVEPAEPVYPVEPVVEPAEPVDPVVEPLEPIPEPVEPVVESIPVAVESKSKKKKKRK